MDAIAAAATRRLESPLHAVSAPPVEATRTLPVTAEYRLSEVGRKASLLAGGDGRTEQRIKLAVPVTRLHLVHVDGSGVARLKLRPQFKLNAEQRILRIKLAPVYDQPPTLDDLFLEAARNHELERTYHAQRTTSQTTRRDTFDEWRNQVALDFLGDLNRRAVVYPAPTSRRCQLMTDRGAVHFDARRDPGVAKQVPREAFRRFDADIRVRHAQGADLRAKYDAVHAEKQQLMRVWIEAHGSEDQRQRLAAGMFPFREYLDVLTDETLQPLGHLEPYRTDGATRLQAHLRQMGHADAVVAPTELSVITRPLPTATPDQWALMQQIHTVLGDANVQLRERSLAWTRNLHAPKLRLVTALVTTKVGPLALRREFLVPNAAPDATERTQEDEVMKA
ncbi:MAG: hypothetical protein ABMA15_02000 [Vicinamibacterales bacterium]